MLLTITTTYHPATDLGYLLHKHPARVQRFGLNWGEAVVFYPEATETRCTVALLLETNPVALARGREHLLSAYVSPQAYTVNSLMSTALTEVFRTAMAGRCDKRPELVHTPLPLEVFLPTLPCQGGEPLLRELFEPLGYTVEPTPLPLDEQFPDWGASRIYSVRLQHTIRLYELLRHLYILIPVLDGDKHYYIGAAEVEKLARQGQEWLAAHPQRERIIARYLKYHPALIEQALASILREEATPETLEPEAPAWLEIALEKPMSLQEQRIGAVIATLRSLGAQRVLDLGCGEGALLTLLAEERSFKQITGLDVSLTRLRIAERKLKKEMERGRVRLLHSSLVYLDDRLQGYDAAVLMEVIEHIEPTRLDMVERVVFGHAQPRVVILTTPNRDYNPLFGLDAGARRHPDHQFEWSRAEFQAWAERLATQYGYTVRFTGIGAEHPEYGCPTQMAVWERV
ncbi:MAG: 3' terminal RNA ribose 2'-O-methyltransferase Hen1 [Fimbriimonadales bacterium]|nr:MAG: 3' terminal RNA ribose 2'-O-methyltransferase Hen1 [Fimbriimonadales bacterium]